MRPILLIVIGGLCVALMIALIGIGTLFLSLRDVRDSLADCRASKNDCTLTLSEVRGELKVYTTLIDNARSDRKGVGGGP